MEHKLKMVLYLDVNRDYNKFIINYKGNGCGYKIGTEAKMVTQRVV